MVEGGGGVLISLFYFIAQIPVRNFVLARSCDMRIESITF